MYCANMIFSLGWKTFCFCSCVKIKFERIKRCCFLNLNLGNWLYCSRLFYLEDFCLIYKSILLIILRALQCNSVDNSCQSRPFYAIENKLDMSGNIFCLHMIMVLNAAFYQLLYICPRLNYNGVKQTFCDIRWLRLWFIVCWVWLPIVLVTVYTVGLLSVYIECWLSLHFAFIASLHCRM